MSDDALRQSDYPFLNSNDTLVIVMQWNEALAYIQLDGAERGAEVEFQAFNVIDSRDGTLVGPGLNEPPIATVRVTIAPLGAKRFILRDAALAPATQFNKVTTMRVVSGCVRATILSPTQFQDYLRQPASTPIET